jgi:hypothetical protein
MHPNSSPRHPFKALVALLAMAAFVHGVFAQAGPRHHGGSRIDIVTHSTCASDDPGCDCDDDDPDVPDSILVETNDADEL